MEFRTIRINWVIIITLGCCVFGFTADAPAQMYEDLRKEIDQIIYYDTDIKAKAIPGFQLGILYEDATFIYNYGFTDAEQTIPLTDSTIFEIGGLTKVFTALLIDRLVEEQHLRYDQTINELLDSVYHNPALANLTVQDLLTHQSGLPKLPYEFGVKEKDPGNPYAHYTQADLLEFYQRYHPASKKKSAYAYGEVNYALLELVAESVRNTDYEQMLLKQVFKPLAMEDSFVHQNEDRKPTAGYSLSGNLAKAFDFQSFAGALGIKSSMRDLIRFVKANLYGHPELQASLEHIRIPIADTRMNKYAKSAKGWHVIEFKKHPSAILHSGSTNGHRSFIGFVPATRTGVILLSNSENQVDGLGFLILRMLNYNWKKPRG